jgi:phosphate/sulfate permease
LFWSGLIVAGMLFIAYVNGANDNFKGVATLFGSGAANGQARWNIVRTILFAWLLTLPAAALLSAAALACCKTFLS